MTRVLFVLLGIVLSPAICAATGTMKLDSDAERVSYSVGFQVGGDFQRQGWEINLDALIQGIRDAISQSEPRLSAEEMQVTLVSLKRQLVVEQQTARKQVDASFLAANAKKDGVKVLPSGVQYRILRAGTGKRPTLQDHITILYRVTRSDGTQISSTEPDKPKTYPVTSAIPGLREVLPLMAEGARWQIVIPPGDKSGDRDSVGGTGVIIYELEIVSVQPAT